MDATPVTTYPRRSPRIAYDSAIEIRDASQRTLIGRFRNISKSGFGLTCAQSLMVGEVIDIRDNRTVARGQILWARGLDAGGVFVDELVPLF